ncbi:hypothetical protein BH09ACT6_BH09ACT6_16680 [soil metagenome]
MAITRKSIRATVLSVCVVAASLAFVGGAASAAHAEMGPDNTPAQMYSDPEMTGGFGNSGWVADQYDADIYGADFVTYVRYDGQDPSYADAEHLRDNLRYKTCFWDGDSRYISCGD